MCLHSPSWGDVGSPDHPGRREKAAVRPGLTPSRGQKDCHGPDSRVQLSEGRGAGPGAAGQSRLEKVGPQTIWEAPSSRAPSQTGAPTQFSCGPRPSMDEASV